MGCRAIKIVTAISWLLLAVSILLFGASFLLDPLKHYISIADDFHICVSARGFDSRISFYNQADYGPYRGSLIGLTDAKGHIYPPRLRDERFGDSWGVYYRYFQWSDKTLWTLSVSLWYPVIVFAIVPGIWCYRRKSSGQLSQNENNHERQSDADPMI